MFRTYSSTYNSVLGMEERKGEPESDPGRVESPVGPSSPAVPSGLGSQSLGVGLTPTSYGGFTQDIMEQGNLPGLTALGRLTHCSSYSSLIFLYF